MKLALHRPGTLGVSITATGGSGAIRAPNPTTAEPNLVAIAQSGAPYIRIPPSASDTTGQSAICYIFNGADTPFQTPQTIYEDEETGNGVWSMVTVPPSSTAPYRVLTTGLSKYGPFAQDVNQSYSIGWYFPDDNTFVAWAKCAATSARAIGYKLNAQWNIWVPFSIYDFSLNTDASQAAFNVSIASDIVTAALAVVGVVSPVQMITSSALQTAVAGGALNAQDVQLIQLAIAQAQGLVSTSATAVSSSISSQVAAVDPTDTTIDGFDSYLDTDTLSSLPTGSDLTPDLNLGSLMPDGSLPTATDIGSTAADGSTVTPASTNAANTVASNPAAATNSAVNTATNAATSANGSFNLNSFLSVLGTTLSILTKTLSKTGQTVAATPTQTTLPDGSTATTLANGTTTVTTPTGSTYTVQPSGNVIAGTVGTDPVSQIVAFFQTPTGLLAGGFLLLALIASR